MLWIILGRACAPDSTCANTGGAATRPARTTTEKNPNLLGMVLLFLLNFLLNENCSGHLSKRWTLPGQAHKREGAVGMVENWVLSPCWRSPNGTGRVPNRKGPTRVQINSGIRI